MDVADLREWIGRTQSTEDVAAPGKIEGLAAVLDHEIPPWRTGELPPLGHWLYFLPRARQSEIDIDGHPRRGGFLPPVTLPRRMWAGSRISFRAPIEIGAAMTRRSTIADVKAKTGGSGAMIFVTIRHEIATASGTVLTEEQDIVYRDAAAVSLRPSVSQGQASARSAAPERAEEERRRVSPDPTLLFRFAALTFNAHRIHYDREYCRDVEGYPGLVVQGPLTAMLLMDHFLRLHPQADIGRFEFRARRPLYDTASFELCATADSRGADLWALDGEGEKAMIARVVIA